MKIAASIILVSFIVILIIALSKPSNEDLAMVKLTESKINVISSYLLDYQKKKGRFPSKEKWFESLRQDVNPSEKFLKDINEGDSPLDSWGNRFKYEYPGIKNTTSFDLWSSGADGADGGVGIDKDIGNWDK